MSLPLIKRFLKYCVSGFLASLVETVVLWIFSDYVFHGYLGEYILSPLVAFEVAVFFSFSVSYKLIWNERVTRHTGTSFLRHFLAYNLSNTGVFFIKMGLLLALEAVFEWDVVWCNIIALALTGTLNFLVGEKLIFARCHKDGSLPPEEPDEGDGCAR